MKSILERRDSSKHDNYYGITYIVPWIYENNSKAEILFLYNISNHR